MSDAVIVSAARLPIGKFGGVLKDVNDWDLGTTVIGEAVKRAGVQGEDIDEVFAAGADIRAFLLLNPDTTNIEFQIDGHT